MTKEIAASDDDERISGLDQWITNRVEEGVEVDPLTIEKLEEILTQLSDVRHHLPVKPEGDDPIVMTEYEEKLYRKNGQFTRHWRDGSMSIILSPERMEELKKYVGEVDE